MMTNSLSKAVLLQPEELYCCQQSHLWTCEASGGLLRSECEKLPTAGVESLGLVLFVSYGRRIKNKWLLRAKSIRLIT